MSPDRDPLVSELLRVRKRQHVTQQGLADLSGVSRRAIAAMEGGGDVTLSTLRKLGAALSLDIQLAEARGASVKRPTLDDVFEAQRVERFGRRGSE